MYSRQIIINKIGNFANRGSKMTTEYPTMVRKMQTTTMAMAANYATDKLSIPNNINAAETTRFSPQRSRDISATVITTQYGQPNIDITAESNAADPHVQSYDCFGAVSLNSVMQSNVPNPFGGMHKFTHLNMPGGQWSQDYKFMSQNLQSSHYTTLRENARADWVAYDQNATIDKKERITNWNAQTKRSYCTKAATDEKPQVEISKKEQLKKVFKEYGATVVVFHVAISLVSLGGFYLLVSGGIDMMPMLDYLGLSSSALSSKVAAGASTFVVAYAIHKVFAPVRISITLGATPFIVRYLRSKGLLKPKIIKQK